MRRRTAKSAAPDALEGPRLILRPFQLSDVNEAYQRWMNDPEVTRFLESRFQPKTLKSLRDYAAGILADHSQVYFAIVLKPDGRHIGNLKIGPIHPVHRHANIGIIIGERDCWGKGYAAEAIQAATRFAFESLNLHKVMAGCDEPNEGSARAFEKAGFKREGLRRNHFYCDGRYVDEILLGRVNPDGLAAE